MKAIMLVLTEECNLACRYCYEKSSGHAMSFEHAKGIIDKEMMNAREEIFKIFFFGGEPLVNFKVLKQVFEYIEIQYPYRVEKYALTTNGTLIRNHIQRWLYENRDRFEITLSLDGTRQMHDRNRITRQGKGSFGMLNLQFFYETWPKCIAKMTISPDTLYDFAEGIIFIEEQGFNCKANFASGIDFRLRNNKKIIAQNLLKLVDYYSSNEKSLCYMLDLPLKAVLIPLDRKFRYCSAGEKRHCYSSESDEWYPCQGLMPMSVETENIFKFETFDTGSIQQNSKCSKCKMIRICRTCYAMNYQATHDVYQPDEQMCVLNQMCMISSARIHYNRLKKQGVSDRQLERAIYLIATELNHVFDEQ